MSQHEGADGFFFLFTQFAEITTQGYQKITNADEIFSTFESRYMFLIRQRVRVETDIHFYLNFTFLYTWEDSHNMVAKMKIDIGFA